ncbi:hypothetical protein [Paraglaciecola sp.]|uniref:hypothetical protein n=1 Tax=Paraglaciecola sp. TaxID=1920173 RepID=UPI0032630946
MSITKFKGNLTQNNAIKVVMVIVFGLLTANSFAAGQAIQEGKITKLFVSNDTTGKPDSQRVIVRLEADVPNGLCPKKVYWQMLLTNPAEKAQFDLLLASYMNGKKVKIWGNKDLHCIHKGEKIRNVEVVL